MTEDARRVEHNPGNLRYELYVGDRLAGFTQYHDSGDRVVFTHTEVDDAFAGQGIGSALAGGALDDVVARDKVIVPVCSFIAGYLRRHPGRYEGHVQATGTADG